MALIEASTDVDRIEDMRRAGVRFVRILYPDLHGIARGKVIPISEFEHIASEGIPFVAAIMTVDLKHNVVGGFETGFEDILGKPDPSTLVRVPWDDRVAWCLTDLQQMNTGDPYPVDPRGALRRTVGKYAEIGIAPVLGPELEFYLCEQDDSARTGFRRYMDIDSHVYTVGHTADRLGILEDMLETSVALGLNAFAANQEYGRGQFEINLRHSEAMDSADRAFLFKTLVKEMAARQNLLATFMGKPWNDDEGSGFHLHVSLAGDSNPNMFVDPSGEDGLSEITRHFIAGILEHARALMAFLNPTVNAYRRLTPESLVPTRVNWGHDNRFTFIRVPQERGRGTRVEIRVADGAASPHLAYAAALLAGLDGIRRRLTPPPPLSGLIYELPEEQQGPELPKTLDEALVAMQEDELIRDGLGA